ncbi:hypothetical protein V8G54_004223 [Vigna mungo]|uniref:Telomeric single stranded DNA binding POT1/Cdc13 domain-containing protein n=1 Tax=Vigna mungo TaxID=3915 RepID=A0AAQ3PEQ8_VIGMU
MVVPLRNVSRYLNRKVDVIGVVMETTFTKKTKGTAAIYFIGSRLMNFIVKVYSEPVVFTMAANVFATNNRSLPIVAAVGDIIKLCLVVVGTFNGEVNVTYRKSISSFALYKGKDGDILDPYQVSPNFFPRDADKIIIAKLRKWLVNFQLCEDSSKFPMFRELKEDIYVNLACKILHLSEPEKDEWLMYVWDGTDTPPNAICSNLQDEHRIPLPLQVELLPLSRDILCTLPTVGSIIRIVFDEGMQNSHFHLLTVGKWVKITYLRLELHCGLWYGVFTLQSKVRYISSEDQLIVERQRVADERLSMPYLSFPQPSPTTAVNHCEHVSHVTLMSVLTHPEVTAIFKCVVRVVAAMACEDENPSSYKYKLRLTLEDSTARIHAHVIGEDLDLFGTNYTNDVTLYYSVTLFDGHPDVDKWTKKLDILLEGSEVCNNGRKRNPPWVCVCLKSYYLSEDDIWGTRNFRVFDTKIMEDSS